MNGAGAIALTLAIYLVVFFLLYWLIYACTSEASAPKLTNLASSLLSTADSIDESSPPASLLESADDRSISIEMFGCDSANSFLTICMEAR